MEPVFRDGELSEPVRSWPEAAEGGVLGRDPELERFLIPVRDGKGLEKKK